MLVTVFNRCDITIQGLRRLYVAIAALPGDYFFDVYLTDDGCTDGTPKAVAAEFPDIHIVQGDGSLFWGGGMRLAWKAAVESVYMIKLCKSCLIVLLTIVLWQELFVIVITNHHMAGEIEKIKY